jgi:peptidoglycan/LPS O-acetylase OafA/YrhL
MRNEESTDSSTKKNLVIDLLRVFSALIVIFYHWRFGPTDLMLYGFLGVPLFFTISGYVMFHVYDSTPKNIDAPVQFLLNRFLRLLPPVFIILSFSYLLTFSTNFKKDFDLMSYSKSTQFLSYLFDVTLLRWTSAFPGLNQATWSLWVEFRFYFLIAILLFFSIKRNLLVPFSLIWLYLVILNSVSPLVSPLREILILDNFYAQGPSGSAIFFIIGIFLGSFNKNKSRFLLVPIALSVVIGFHQISYLIDTNGTLVKKIHGPGFLIFSGFLILVFFSNQLNSKLLVFSKFIRTLGRSTYYVYLLHYFLGYFLVLKLEALDVIQYKWIVTGFIFLVSFVWAKYLEHRIAKAVKTFLQKI